MGVNLGVTTSVGRAVAVRTAVGVLPATSVPGGRRVLVVKTKTAVCVWCWLRSGIVAVPSGVRLGTVVKVLLGVKVGVAEMRGVAVAVGEAVLVGTVAVGKGLSSACAVPARVVLIASMF